jgi:hypothetical protein
MNPCSREEQSLEASASGRWGDELRVHFSACSSCQEAVKVASFMRQLAAASAPERSLADSRTVWCKAQLVRRWALEQRAGRPVEFTRRVGQAAGIAIPLGFVAWNWAELRVWLGSVEPGSLNLLAASGSPSIFFWIVALSVGMVAASAILTLQTLLGQD